ncbi:MAG: Isoquinoline 1-oxidoreductase subunit, partial [Sphingomonas sp.]
MMRAQLGVFALGAAVVAMPIAVMARGEAQSGLKDAGTFVSITDPAARSAALFTEMGKVLQHPRCLNCHPRT